ncbi:MAG TPA: cyclic nucleotide-binding domain-containing protein [Anaerolineales bacterium]
MSSFADLLKQSEIFDQFTSAQLDLVAALCKEVTFNAGEMIFPENSRSTDLYVITRGEVDVLINPAIVSPAGMDQQEDTRIARLRRGQSFGEVALVDEGLRSASARAAQDDTHLLMIPREKLIMLCEAYPPLGFRLMYNLAADLAMKMRNADLRFRESQIRPSGNSE